MLRPRKCSSDRTCPLQHTKFWLIRATVGKLSITWLSVMLSLPGLFPVPVLTGFKRLAGGVRFTPYLKTSKQENMHWISTDTMETHKWTHECCWFPVWSQCQPHPPFLWLLFPGTAAFEWTTGCLLEVRELDFKPLHNPTLRCVRFHISLTRTTIPRFLNWTSDPHPPSL